MTKGPFLTTQLDLKTEVRYVVLVSIILYYIPIDIIDTALRDAIPGGPSSIIR